MSQMKRGRLRSVTTRPMYDKNKALSGYSVQANHEPDEDDMGAGNSPMQMGSYPGESETPHETLDSAKAMVHTHLAENEKKFGGKKGKRSAPPMNADQAQAAFGRN